MKNQFLKNKIFNKLAFFILGALILLMPFQAFLLTVARFKLGLSEQEFFFFSLWKEYLLGILLLLAGIKFIREKKFFEILNLDKAILAFFSLVLVYFVFYEGGIEQKLAGVRYDLEFFVIYFLARIFNFSVKDVKKFLKILLIASFSAIAFGLLQAFVIPPSFLVNLGYSLNWNEYVKTGIIPTFEVLSQSLPGLYRIQSTFPGDIQFASFLLMLLSFGLAFAIKLKEKKWWILFGFSLLALALTFTRSAWIGAIFSLFLIILVGTKSRRKVFGAMGITVLLVGVLLLATLSKEQIAAIIYHGENKDGQIIGSTAEHKSAVSESLDVAKKNPLGQGLGSAGPASKFAENLVIPESWYLQIALEFGVFGLIVFLAIIGLLFKELYLIYRKSTDPFLQYFSLGFLGSLVGLSVQNIFLHTWADTATAYTFWIFVGLMVSLANNKEKSNKNELNSEKL